MLTPEEVSDAFARTVLFLLQLMAALLAQSAVMTVARRLHTPVWALGFAFVGATWLVCVAFDALRGRRRRILNGTPDRTEP